MAKKRRNNTVKIISLFIFALVLLSAGRGYLWWRDIYAPIEEEYQKYSSQDWETGQEGGQGDEGLRPTVVLVLGLDQRANEPARADTIMLFSMHWETEELSVLSIPRDTRAAIPTRGPEKVNHAHVYGGAALTKKTVEDLLGIRIDRYMETNFVGFEKVVDILGGVELEVEKRMRYYASDVTIELDPGLQRLDGDKALQYVRFRADAAGDLGRVERQQKFVKSLIKEMYQLRTIFHIPRIMDQLAANFRTDMDFREMRDFVTRVQEMELKGINTFTLPGEPRYIDGVSYVVVNRGEMDKIVSQYIMWEDSKGAI